MSDLGTVCERCGDRAAGWVMQAHLSDLDGYWLELHCCSGTTLLPVKLVRQRRGDGERLAEILPRLSCKMCHSPPRRAWLNETPNRTPCNGAPPGWAVQLIPRVYQLAEAAE